MKLLARYNRVNVLATVIVLLMSGLSYYFIIRYVLLNQLDEDLKVEEQEIIDYVSTNKSLPNPSNYKDQVVSFLQNDGQQVKRKFSSSTLFSKEENENITNRQIVFPMQVTGKNYTVTISKSEEETEDLIQLILLLTLAMVMVLLAVLFVINRFLLSKLWRPFNSTLRELKQFNLSNNTHLQLENTRISEFSDLNEAVTAMSNRVRQDYIALKTFTENASHEMQTPLAIINSKLDVLIQDETLNEHQMEQLQGIYNALDRLSNLNQSLLLLTKIENNQFNGKENIQLDQQVKEKLLQFEEWIQSKKLQVLANLQETGIQSNKQLTDILVGNLLNNAIRYTQPGGEISVTLKAGVLQVSNTSAIPALDTKKVFQRFYRHSSTNQDGNGLGLSIVKQICDMAGYTVAYDYNGNHHHFLIHF